jgi:hypothetical protein
MAHNFNFTESGYSPINYNFNFGLNIYIYYVLVGTSNNFTAIWADPTTSLYTGKIYITSPAAFSIVNNTVLVDYYTTTHFGAANEVLEQKDIIDINIVM